MATFAGQATVAARLASDAAVVAKHAFRASVRASGAHPAIYADTTLLVAGSNQTFDMAAGASLRVASMFDSSPGVGTPTTGDIRCFLGLYTEGDVSIRVVQVVTLPGGWTAGTDVQGTVVDFYATHDGTATGTPRAGTYQLVVSMEYGQVTNDGVNGRYSVNSLGGYTLSGTPNTWAATARAQDDGYLRASTSATLAVAGSGVRSYPDVVALTADLAAPSIDNRTLTLVLGPSSAASNSTTDNHTRNITINNTFPAAATPYTPSITVPNSSFSGLPWTVLSTVTADEVTVDPRITVGHHLQVDDDVFGSDKADSDNRYSANESGFYWARFLNARGEGVPDVAGNQRLDPVKPGTVAGPTNFTDSDASGYSNVKLDHTTNKPTGQWDHIVAVTTPSWATGDFLLDGTETFFMTAPKTNYGVIPGAGGSEATGANLQDHWSPGQDLMVGGVLFDDKALDIAVPDETEGVAPFFLIGRFRGDGKLEHLADDLTTWLTLPDDVDPDTTVNSIPLERADTLIPGADTRVWLRLIPGSITGAWADRFRGLFVAVVMHDLDGARYRGSIPLGPVGQANLHSGYGFDPVAYASLGKVTFR